MFQENGINAYRLQFETLDCVKFYGIYFEYEDKKELPLVICQHGGWGSPELCSGLLETTSNYNEMTERVLKYGVNVFAPQMLLWKQEDYGIEFNRAEVDAKLKQAGSSIAAVEVFALMKSIDYLSTLDAVNENKIGMVGLSYGGFYYAVYNCNRYKNKSGSFV